MLEYSLSELKTEDKSRIYVEKKCQPDHDIHCHDFTELVVVLSGYGVHTLQGEHYPVSEGDIAAIGDGCLHGFVDTQDLVICNIMYSSPDLSHVADGLSHTQTPQTAAPYCPLTEVGPHESYKMKLSSERFPYAKMLVNLMVDQYSIRSEGFQYKTQTYFSSLLIYLSQVVSNERSGDDESYDGLNKAISYIKNHYKEPIRLHHLADRVNLSERHLSRVFRRRYGLSPINYINRLRVRHACSYLTETELNITEIALECGFGDSNYFARQFRKWLGMSPSQYRACAHKIPCTSCLG